MNWIKKNPAPFILALVSLGSLGMAGVLYSKVSEFPSGFSKPVKNENNKVDPADLAIVEEAAKSTAKPAGWQVSGKSGRLFISKKCIEKDGKLVFPEETEFPLHTPLENKWIIANNLDITSGTLLSEDPDADGFSNLDEWNGLDAKSHLMLPAGGEKLQPVVDASGATLPADSTDPQDPKSHPGYVTKLRLVDVRKVPFRLILKSYDGKPDKKEAMTFFVNTVDRARRTELLKIGDQIPSDKRYKLVDFEQKIEKKPDGIEEDKSELVIVNTEYNEKLALPLNVMVDSPESYAIFRYLWVGSGAQPTPDFPVKKNGEFSLQPEPEKKYKVLKFGTGNVEIQTPSGEKLTISVTQ